MALTNPSCMSLHRLAPARASGSVPGWVGCPRSGSRDEVLARLADKFIAKTAVCEGAYWYSAVRLETAPTKESVVNYRPPVPAQVRGMGPD